MYVHNPRRDEKKPGWISRVTSKLRGLFSYDGVEVIAKVDDTNSRTFAYLPEAAITSSSEYWKVGNQRKAVHRDIEYMDATDEIISGALDYLADCAVDFIPAENEELIRLRVSSDDEKVQKIVDDLIDRLELNGDGLWQITRDMVKHGGIFREVVLDRPRNRIGALKQTVVWSIWPNETKKGDRIPGWVQKLESNMLDDTGVYLDEWQIAPFYWGIRFGNLYVPLLNSARATFRKLTAIEDGAVHARLERAYEKYVHKIPVGANATADEIRETLVRYKTAITKRSVASGENIGQQDNPYSTNTDFFLPDDGSGRGSVDTLTSANNQLMNFTDVYYLREKLLSRLKVPIQFFQIQSTQKTHVYSGKSNIDFSFQFSRTLKSVQASIIKGLKRIINVELVLHGIVPTKGMYTIHLNAIEIDNASEQAKTLLTLAQSATYFKEVFGAMPPEFIAEKFLSLSDAELQLIKPFLEGDGKKMFKEMVKKVKENPTGEGSGNNNKTFAERTTEQKPLPEEAANQAAKITELEDMIDELTTSVMLENRTKD